MAVAYFHEWPGVTQEMAQRVRARLYAQLGNAAPEGGIYAADGEADGAYCTFDVWESEDAAQRFFDEMLKPAPEAVGAPQAQRRTLSIQWHTLEVPNGAG